MVRALHFILIFRFLSTPLSAKVGTFVNYAGFFSITIYLATQFGQDFARIISLTRTFIIIGTLYLA